ncbi:MAG TPA: thioesterase domain-containing protein [Rhodanobacter sp.]|nr:thioesterase domain-containing protein [Rhodanobacter sp.]
MEEVLTTTRACDPPEGKPEDAVTAMLTGIFARVLRQTSILPDDDFFDLGGDSILMFVLLLEIEQATGRSLPVTAIYDAPTVAKMTTLLNNEPATERSSLVLLKPGVPALPPLFIAHGLGGTVMELAPLGRRLEVPNAIYCLEARGLDGIVAPFNRIEDMAAHFLGEVRTMQPKGPYLLGGSCFGGLVALELAQRLSQAGERVALLALLNTYPHSRCWPAHSRLRTWFRLLWSLSFRMLGRRMTENHLAAIRAMPVRQIGPYLLRVAGRGATLPFRIFGLSAYVPDPHQDASPRGYGQGEPALPTTMHRVHQAGKEAFARYRPSLYDGELSFLRTESAVRLPFDATWIWRRLATKLTITTVRGDRQQMLGQQLPDVAAELSRMIRAALHT